MLHIFPVQIRSVARMDSLKSAWRDQAENPESYAGSLLFREVQESIFAAPDCKDVSVRKKSAPWMHFQRFARYPSPGYDRRNRHNAEIVRAFGANARCTNGIGREFRQSISCRPASGTRI